MCVQKQAVTVAEMARMVGLSRSRFYQLVGSAFPLPQYNLATKRPFYPVDLQEACLEVRRRNCGVDGKPILFQRRGRETTPVNPKPSKRKAMPDDHRHQDLLAGLKSLGLTSVTAVQVEKALKELHVSGSEGKDQGQTLRAVFLKLKQDTSSPAPKQKDNQHDVS